MMRSLPHEVSLSGTSPRSSKTVVVRSLKREYTGKAVLRLTYENSNIVCCQELKGCVVDIGKYKRMYQLGGCDPVDPFLNPKLAQTTVLSPFVHYVYNSSLYEVCFFVAIYLTGLMF